ncbi:uncharacterized protein LOC141928460 [Strix aluco]|uniref:uncharacterized protein LOC141928460 n=1 Tax=Strix aluco TaxID=111821 RepID=UPI003DA47CB3
MVRVQGAMALTRHLLLILLLLVALHARAARAAPWRPRGADEAGGSGYPASRLDVGLEPLGHPRDPLEVDGFPTSSSVPVLEPESSPTDVPVGEGDAASRPGPGTEPAGDGVDVPAGRAFPAPRPHPAPESDWRRRGPARAKNPAEGGKKSPEPLDNVKKTLEELERGHGTDREAAQETAFPKGSSGSLPASAAETEATRAPGTPVISKPRRDNPSRADSDVPAGRAFPAPRLHLAPQSGWRRKGAAREKDPAEGGKKSPEPSDNVKKTLEELERGHGTDREAAQETAFPKGSSGSLPASAAETEATRAPGTPVISKPRQDNPSRADSGVVGERTATVSPLQIIAAVSCPQDVWMYCMLSAVSLVISVTVALLLCCTWVRRRWRRKGRAAAASGQGLETGGPPSHPPQPDQPPWYP